MRSWWIMAISPSIRRYGRSIAFQIRHAACGKTFASLQDQAKGRDTDVPRPLTLSRPRLLRVFPGRLRQRHRALGRLHGLGIRRGAVANPPADTLRDAR